MLLSLFSVSIYAILVSSTSASTPATTSSQIIFNSFSPTLNTFTVPNGVSSLTLSCRGANGARNKYINNGPTPGIGSYISGSLSVSSGDILHVQPGSGALTAGCSLYDSGGNGGGASIITLNQNTVPVIVAGGGGGAGTIPCASGGDGGWPAGNSGGCSGGGDGGGQQQTVNTGQTAQFTYPGSIGTKLSGGSGYGTNYSSACATIGGSGGGGGGWYGGSAGSSSSFVGGGSGGGGGSSYYDPSLTNIVFSEQDSYSDLSVAGNGYCVVSYVSPCEHAPSALSSNFAPLLLPQSGLSLWNGSPQLVLLIAVPQYFSSVNFDLTKYCHNATSTLVALVSSYGAVNCMNTYSITVDYVKNCAFPIQRLSDMYTLSGSVVVSASWSISEPAVHLTFTRSVSVPVVFYVELPREVTVNTDVLLTMPNSCTLPLNVSDECNGSTCTTNNTCLCTRSGFVGPNCGIDIVPPTWICPASSVLYLTGATQTTATLPATFPLPSASDALSVSSEIRTINDLSSNASATVNVLPPYSDNLLSLEFSFSSFSIVYTAMDPSHNSAQCSFSVTVLDRAPPRLTCPSPFTTNNVHSLQHNSSVWSQISLTDNVDRNPQLQLPNFTPNSNGVYTLIVYAVDASGNRANCSFIVTYDTVPPACVNLVLTFNVTTNVTYIPASLIINSILGYTFTDNLSGVENVNITRTLAPINSATVLIGLSQAYGNVVLKDYADNINRCAIIVNVFDKFPPRAVCSPPVTVSTDIHKSYATVNVDQLFTVSDNWGIDTTLTTPSVVSFTAEYACCASSTVPVLAVDLFDNTASCTITIDVVDTELPIVNCPANRTIPVAWNSSSINFTAIVNTLQWSYSDNVAVANVTYSPALNALKNNYILVANSALIVVLTVVDSSGNTATCASTFTVSDNQPPAYASCLNQQTLYLTNGVTHLTQANAWLTPVATDNVGVVLQRTSITQSGVQTYSTTFSQLSHAPSANLKKEHSNRESIKKQPIQKSTSLSSYMQITNEKTKSATTAAYVSSLSPKSKEIPTQEVLASFSQSNDNIRIKLKSNVVTVGLTNVALTLNGAVATAYSSYGVTYPPSNAINGQITGANWASTCSLLWAGSPQNWMQVTFSNSYWVNEVDVFMEPGWFLTSFQIQAWNSATSSFVTLPGGTYTNNNVVWVQLLLSTPVYTNIVRISITGCNAAYCHICQLQVLEANTGFGPSSLVAGAADSNPGYCAFSHANAAPMNGTISSISFYLNYLNSNILSFSLLTYRPSTASILNIAPVAVSTLKNAAVNSVNVAFAVQTGDLISFCSTHSNITGGSVSYAPGGVSSFVVISSQPTLGAFAVVNVENRTYQMNATYTALDPYASLPILNQLQLCVEDHCPCCCYSTAGCPSTTSGTFLIASWPSTTTKCTSPCCTGCVSQYLLCASTCATSCIYNTSNNPYYNYVSGVAGAAGSYGSGAAIGNWICATPVSSSLPHSSYSSSVLPISSSRTPFSSSHLPFSSSRFASLSSFVSSSANQVQQQPAFVPFFDVPFGSASVPTKDSLGHSLSSGSAVVSLDNVRGYVLSSGYIFSTSLELPSSYTKLAWCYPSSSGHIFSSASNASSQVHYLYVNNTRNVNAGHANDGRLYNLVSQAQIPLNVWSFLAVTYDGNSNILTLYYNGVNISTSLSGQHWTGSNSSLCIGCYQQSSQFNFQGKIDNVRAFSFALSRQQVLSIYNYELAYPTSEYAFQGSINVDSLIYGANCHAPSDRSSYLASACNGLSQCSYTFNYVSTGGNPDEACMSKNLVLTYSCGAIVQPTITYPGEAGVSTLIVLNCQPAVSSSITPYSSSQTPFSSSLTPSKNSLAPLAFSIFMQPADLYFHPSATLPYWPGETVSVLVSVSLLTVSDFFSLQLYSDGAFSVITNCWIDAVPSSVTAASWPIGANGTIILNVCYLPNTLIVSPSTSYNAINIRALVTLLDIPNQGFTEVNHYVFANLTHAGKTNVSSDYVIVQPRVYNMYSPGTDYIPVCPNPLTLNYPSVWPSFDWTTDYASEPTSLASSASYLLSQSQVALAYDCSVSPWISQSVWSQCVSTFVTCYSSCRIKQAYCNAGLTACFQRQCGSSTLSTLQSLSQCSVNNALDNGECTSSSLASLALASSNFMQTTLYNIGQLTTCSCTNTSSFINDLAPASILGPGTYNVVVSSYDLAGNVGYCNMTVNVLDENYPDVRCQQEVIVYAISGQSYATVNLSTLATATDVFSIVSSTNLLQSLQLQISPSPSHFYSVGYTACNAYSLCSTCAITIQVRNTQPPTLTLCPYLSQYTVYADQGKSFWSTSGYLPSPTFTSVFAVSEVTNTLIASGLQLIPVFSSFNLSWSATDVWNNKLSNVCSTLLIVIDNQPPTITCPSNTIVGVGVASASSTFTMPSPQLNDNVGVANLTYRIYTETTATSNTFLNQNTGVEMVTLTTTTDNIQSTTTCFCPTSSIESLIVIPYGNTTFASGPFSYMNSMSSTLPSQNNLKLNWMQGNNTNGPWENQANQPFGSNLVCTRELSWRWSSPLGSPFPSLSHMWLTRQFSLPYSPCWSSLASSSVTATLSVIVFTDLFEIYVNSQPIAFQTGIRSDCLTYSLPISIQIPVRFFTPGSNVIALHVHSQGPSGSYFNIQLEVPISTITSDSYQCTTTATSDNTFSSIPVSVFQYQSRPWNTTTPLPASSDTAAMFTLFNGQPAITCMSSLVSLAAISTHTVCPGASVSQTGLSHFVTLNIPPALPSSSASLSIQFVGMSSFMSLVIGNGNQPLYTGGGLKNITVNVMLSTQTWTQLYVLGFSAGDAVWSAYLLSTVAAGSGSSTTFISPVIVSQFNLVPVSSFAVVNNQSLQQQWGVGNYAVVYSVDDTSYNYNSCTFNVTVVDTSPPVMTCVNVGISTATRLDLSLGASAFDNVDGRSLIWSYSSQANLNNGELLSKGSFNITAFAKDYSGNVASCTYTLVVHGVCGDDIVDPDREECDSTVGCASNCTCISPNYVSTSFGCALNFVNNQSSFGTFTISVSNPVGAQFFIFPLNTTTSLISGAEVIDASRFSILDFAFDFVSNLKPENYIVFDICSNCAFPHDFDLYIDVNASQLIEASDECRLNANVSVPSMLYNSSTCCLRTPLCGSPESPDTSLPQDPLVFVGQLAGAPGTSFVQCLNTSPLDFYTSIADPTSISSAVVTWNVSTRFEVPPFVTFSSNIQPGDRLPVGSYRVVYDFTNGVNSTSCSWQVTVHDGVSPVISPCPSSVVSLDSDYSGLSLPSAYDETNGGEPVFVTVMSTIASSILHETVKVDSTFPQSLKLVFGEYAIEYSATDASNNKATCNFTIIMADNIPPIFTSCRDITSFCMDLNAWYATGTFDASPTDFLGINSVTLSTDTAVLDMVPGLQTWNFSVGSRAVTLTATDLAGNAATCDSVWTIRDCQIPTLSCPTATASVSGVPVLKFAIAGTLGAYVDSLSTYAGYFAWDNDVNMAVMTNVTLPAWLPTGPTYVSVTATDTALNSASCVFVVYVTQSLPVLTGCPANLTTSIGVPYAWTLPVATDTVDITVAVFVSLNGTIINQLNPFLPFGTTNVTYIATNSEGNRATCQQTINVVNTQPPVFTSCPSMMHACMDLSYPYATITHQAVIDLISLRASTGIGIQSITAVNFTGGVTQLRVYQTSPPSFLSVYAVDVTGLSSVCSINFIIDDCQSPTVICPSDMLVDLPESTSTNATVVYEVMAYDNVVSDLIVTYSIPSGSELTPGTYTITVSATDSASPLSSALCSFHVMVHDPFPPLLECPSSWSYCGVSSVSVPTGSSALSFFGINASDVSGISRIDVESNSSSISVSGEPTMISITAVDGNGNTAQCSFLAAFVSCTPPSITCPTSTTTCNFDSSAVTSLINAEPTSSDNIVGIRSTMLLSSSTQLTYSTSSNVGIHSRTWIATNNAGLTATCSFNVTVTDCVSPVFNQCPSTTVTLSTVLNKNYAIYDASLLTAYDTILGNASLSYTFEENSPDNEYEIGTSVVVVTVSDSLNNEAVCNVQITVVDTQPPYLTCPSDFNVRVCSPLTFPQTAIFEFQIATSSDNSGGVVSLDYSLPQNHPFPVGTSEVNVTATDLSGNVASCTFNVNVQAAYPISPVVAVLTNLNMFTSLNNATEYGASIEITTAVNFPYRVDPSVMVVEVGASDTVSDVSEVSSSCSSDNCVQKFALQVIFASCNIESTVFNITLTEVTPAAGICPYISQSVLFAVSLSAENFCAQGVSRVTIQANLVNLPSASLDSWLAVNASSSTSTAVQSSGIFAVGDLIAGLVQVTSTQVLLSNVSIYQGQREYFTDAARSTSLGIVPMFAGGVSVAAGDNGTVASFGSGNTFAWYKHVENQPLGESSFERYTMTVDVQYQLTSTAPPLRRLLSIDTPMKQHTQRQLNDVREQSRTSLSSVSSQGSAATVSPSSLPLKQASSESTITVLKSSVASSSAQEALSCASNTVAAIYLRSLLNTTQFNTATFASALSPLIGVPEEALDVSDELLSDSSSVIAVVLNQLPTVLASSKQNLASRVTQLNAWLSTLPSLLSPSLSSSSGVATSNTLAAFTLDPLFYYSSNYLAKADCTPVTGTVPPITPHPSSTSTSSAPISDSSFISTAAVIIIVVLVVVVALITSIVVLWKRYHSAKVVDDNDNRDDFVSAVPAAAAVSRSKLAWERGFDNQIIVSPKAITPIKSGPSFDEDVDEASAVNVHDQPENQFQC